MASRRPSPPVVFAMGIEIECYLRPKDNETLRHHVADAQWRQNRPGPPGYHRGMLHKVLQAHLLEQGIASRLDSDDKFEHWAIDGDTTLVAGEGGGFFSVELVSPIFLADMVWQQEIHELFKAIAAGFDIRVDERYGTHVHVSPSADRTVRWTVREVAAILKAVAVFDESIVDMLPPERKANLYAGSNFSHSEAPPALRRLHAAAVASGRFQDVFAFLDRHRSTGAFAALYGGRRWFMFNMSNLADGPGSSGTIEFRSAPASPDPRTAIHWVAWVLSFMTNATHTDWGRAGGPSGPAGRRGTISDLWRFVLEGSERLPEASRGLDTNRLRKVAGPSPFTAKDYAEMDLAKKDKEKKRARYAVQ